MFATLAALALAAPTVHKFDDLTLAPSGEWLAAVERDQVADRSSTHPVVAVRDTSNGHVIATLDPCAVCSYAAPAWSPDGRRLAFVARSGSKEMLYVADVGAPAVLLVRIDGALRLPEWSPNGQEIAILATPGAVKRPGADQAGVKLLGEVASGRDRQRIWVVDADSGARRFISPADIYVYEYAWRPDGREIVGVAVAGDGDANWWIASIHAFDIGTRKSRVVATPNFQVAYPRVSKDGLTVYFIGGLMSDFNQVGGNIYSVPLDGGELHNWTEALDASVTSLVLTDKIIATGIAREKSSIYELDTSQGRMRTLWSAALSITAADFKGRVALDNQARVAFVAEGFDQPPAIFVGSLTAPIKITNNNDGLRSGVVAESIVWHNEGYTVQGWLLHDPQAARARRNGLIVVVHGGPSDASMPIFALSGTVHSLLTHGYYVFKPNPRGSYGSGGAFTRANRGDFGGGDLRDILTGLDVVERVAPIDTKRIGIYGYSYGGFMAMHAVGTTKRFKAAVAGAGIANWVSYYGQNGINQWMIPFYGVAAYDDPDAYWKASPLRTIKNVSAPTLLYVGELDIECPPAQSMEFWNGLRAHGVPTSFVVYEGEGHQLQSAHSVLDSAARTTAWFDKFLNAD